MKNTKKWSLWIDSVINIWNFGITVSPTPSFKISCLSPEIHKYKILALLFFNISSFSLCNNSLSLERILMKNLQFSLKNIIARVEALNLIYCLTRSILTSCPVCAIWLFAHLCITVSLSASFIQSDFTFISRSLMKMLNRIRCLWSPAGNRHSQRSFSSYFFRSLTHITPV